jgi:hypothetical protein
LHPSSIVYKHGKSSLDDPRNLGITCMHSITFYFLYNWGSILKASLNMEFITSFVCILLVSNGLSIDFKCATRWIDLEVQARGSAHGGCHYVKQTWYKCLLSPFGGVFFNMN